MKPSDWIRNRACELSTDKSALLSNWGNPSDERLLQALLEYLDKEADQPAPTETLNAEDSEAFQQLLNAPAEVVPALAKALRERRQRRAHALANPKKIEPQGAHARVSYVDGVPIGVELVAPQGAPTERCPACGSWVRDYGCFSDGKRCHDVWHTKEVVK